MIQSCLLSLRGELEVTFCVTLSTSWIKMMFSLATTPHKTVGNASPAKERDTQKEAVVETSVVRSARESGRGRYKDPVQETFKKLYAPNSGKRIKYGVFQETMSASEKNAYTDEEKTNLRRKAAEELTVIDKEERKRRGWFWFVCFLFKSVSKSRFSFFYSHFTRERAFHRAVL